MRPHGQTTEPDLEKLITTSSSACAYAFRFGFAFASIPSTSARASCSAWRKVAIAFPKASRVAVGAR